MVHYINSLLIITILSINIKKTRADYQIKEGTSTRFLYSFINDETGDVFPKDFMIEISLSRVAGTLFYSIDNRNNQLIISINDVNKVTLAIEFNTQKSYINLSKLCSTESIRYKKFKLRIQIEKAMSFQCIRGATEEIPLGRKAGLNKDYPIHTFNQSDNLQAHLYLVNTPYFHGLFPNSAQLSGCIFGVWYKMIPLDMVSHGMANTCPITCKKNICNAGKCLETYNNYPVCNCTTSFKNGQFCNETMLDIDYEVSQLLQFEVLKLSFTSNSEIIMKILNKFVTLQILAIKNELILLVNCNSTYETEIRSTISKKYRRNDENIILLVFEETFIDVKYGTNGSNWIHIRVPHIHELKREIFIKLMLGCNQGVVDFAYKEDINTMRWNRLDFEANVHEPTPNISQTTKQEEILTTTRSLEEDTSTPTISEKGLMDSIYSLKNIVFLELVLLIVTMGISLTGMILLLKIFRSKRRYEKINLIKNPYAV